MSGSAPGLERPPVDAFVESYVAWLEQSAAVRTAYERWTADRDQSGAAFTLYRVELEFEERAARAHQAAAERLAPSRRAAVPSRC